MRLMDINPDFYLSLSPQDRKKFRHIENKTNFPERHNPTSETIYPHDDICYECVNEWAHKYYFDIREYCYKRINGQRG